MQVVFDSVSVDLLRVRPWNLVPYWCTSVRPKFIPVTDGGFSEAELHARSLMNRRLDQVPPDYDQYPVGTWGEDASGELMQLREYDIDDLRLIFPEGLPNNSTVQKYARWIEEGTLPPPGIALETEKGNIKIHDGHHRHAAIRLSGLTTMKLWVSITVLVPIGGDGVTVPRGIRYSQFVESYASEAVSKSR